MSSEISSRGLHPPRLHEDLLPVGDRDPGPLKREQDRQLHHVDAERLVGDAELVQLPLDLAGDVLGDPGAGVERAAQRGDPGPGAALPPRPGAVVVRRVRVGVRHAAGRRQPRVEQLVVLGGRAEVPDDRVGRRGSAARTGSACPSPRCRCGWRTCSGCWRSRRPAPRPARSARARPQPGQPLHAQPVELDALLPVDGVRAESGGAAGHVGAFLEGMGAHTSRAASAARWRRRTFPTV